MSEHKSGHGHGPSAVELPPPKGPHPEDRTGVAWACSECTAVNKPSFLVCGVCRRPRRTLQDAAHVASDIIPAASAQFDYTSLERPPELPSVVFEKAVQLFRQLDEKGYGRVQYKLLADKFADLFKGDLSEEVIRRLVQNKKRHKRKPVHIRDLLSSIVRMRKRAQQTTSKEDTGKGITDQFSLFRRNSMTILQEDKQLKEYHELGTWGRTLYAVHQWWLRNWVNREALINLWVGTFKLIEAKFGASTVSYFYFARSIVWLNIISSFIFFFLIGPGLFDQKSYHITGSEWSGLVIGTGMEDSFLFYGGYKARYYDGKYRMDLAFLVCVGLMLFLSLLVTLRYLDKGDMFSEGDSPFASLVFTHDFNVRDPTQLKLHSLRLRTALNTQLKEADELRAAKRLGQYDWLRRTIGLLLTACFVAATSGLVGWMILNEDEKIVPSLEQHEFGAYVATLAVPGTVAFFRALSPFVVEAIVSFEGYPRAQDRFRNVFMRNFIIQMLYIMVVLFQTILNVNVDKKNVQEQVCRETQVGLIYYKLLWVDLAFEFGLSVFLPWLQMKCSCKARDRDEALSEYDQVMMDNSAEDVDKSEFAIPESIVDVMYRQALVWSGAPFCPFLPFLAVICGSLTMAIKKWQVIYFSKPSAKPMGVAHQHRYFKGVLVVTLIISFLPFTFFLRRKVECGPHSGERPIDVFFQEYVSSLPEWAQLMFAYLSNIVLLWLIILLVSVYVLYVRKAETLLHGELRHLRQRLKLEAREKQAIIRENHIELDEDQQRGRELFRAFIDDMGTLGHRYAGNLIDHDLGDMFTLLQLEDDQLRAVMMKFKAPEIHIQLFLERLQERRIELI